MLPKELLPLESSPHYFPPARHSSGAPRPPGSSPVCLLPRLHKDCSHPALRLLLWELLPVATSSWTNKHTQPMQAACTDPAWEGISKSSPCLTHGGGIQAMDFLPSPASFPCI